MDLFNLPEKLKRGNLISRGDKTCTLESPVGRLSFPHVAEPQDFEGKYRFGCSLIFNVGDKTKPAFVDLSAVEGELKSVAQQCRIDLTRLPVIGHGEKTNRNGELISGYESYTSCMSFNKPVKDSKARPIPCFDVTGANLDPHRVEELAGYYARVRFDVYVNKPGKTYPSRVCLGLKWIQIIAEGELFGAGDAPPPEGFEGEQPLDSGPSGFGGARGGDFSGFGG